MRYPMPPDDVYGSLHDLQKHLPGCTHNDLVDPNLVTGLLDDLPSVIVPEEIKALRRYHDHQPAGSVSDPRLAIRRWVVTANTRTRP